MPKVRRWDDNVIPDTGEIRLFGKIRNERTRLPFFLSYYRSLGVGRFFIVDNGSSDGSAEFLCGEPDCHVFRTEESMAVSRAGMSWLEPLLATHGIGRWCIVVDADELLVHPQAETVPLPQFCADLERTGRECPAVHHAGHVPGRRHRSRRLPGRTVLHRGLSVSRSHRIPLVREWRRGADDLWRPAPADVLSRAGGSQSRGPAAAPDRLPPRQGAFRS